VSDDRDLTCDRNINVFDINVFEWLLKATLRASEANANANENIRSNHFGDRDRRRRRVCGYA
jgi:hypothetical protein